VIPIQFILFSLSAIIGSAILYGDFQKANFHEIITFFYGCAATFAGVFIIAWAPAQSKSDPDEFGDETPSVGDPEQTSPEGSRHGLARRKRVIPILPAEAAKDTPSRRHRSGPSISMIGISPAQVSYLT
jgi:magnesium transporter